MAKEAQRRMSSEDYLDDFNRKRAGKTVALPAGHPIAMRELLGESLPPDHRFFTFISDLVQETGGLV